MVIDSQAFKGHEHDTTASDMSTAERESGHGLVLAGWVCGVALPFAEQRFTAWAEGLHGGGLEDWGSVCNREGGGRPNIRVTLRSVSWSVS